MVLVWSYHHRTTQEAGRGSGRGLPLVLIIASCPVNGNVSRFSLLNDDATLQAVVRIIVVIVVPARAGAGEPERRARLPRRYEPDVCN